MALKLANQIVYVAGGCGTVGSGIVRDLISNGAKVYVSSRSKDRLDQLEKTIPNTHKNQIQLLNSNISTENECVNLKDEILKREGRVNHVVSSLGSFWNKGLLGEQSVDEFKRVVDSCATSHFIVYKTFSKDLSKQEKSTYTFITGALGESCLIPQASLMTVGAAALFGVYQAAAAEYKTSKSLKINEVRYYMWIKNKQDKEYNPEKSQMEVGNDWTAKFVTKIITQHKGGQYKILNRKKGDALYETI